MDYARINIMMNGSCYFMFTKVKTKQIVASMYFYTLW